VVAVVGATDDPGRLQTGIFERVRSYLEPLGAVVHPVNPRREQVAGLRSYPSVREIEAPVDVAVILTGDPAPALADAVEKEVAFAIIFAGRPAHEIPRRDCGPLITRPSSSIRTSASGAAVESHPRRIALPLPSS